MIEEKHCAICGRRITWRKKWARAWDLSGPTLYALVRRRDRDALAARLGPDPLRDDADPDAFVARVRASRRAVGGLLLDQTVVAGVGNVYTITAQLADGLRLGRIVTVDPHRAGTRSRRLYIYKRAHLPALSRVGRELHRGGASHLGLPGLPTAGATARSRTSRADTRRWVKRPGSTRTW